MIGLMGALKLNRVDEAMIPSPYLPYLPYLPYPPQPPKTLLFIK